MIRLGEALTRPDAGVGGPPVQALVVYNSNPAAVAPDSNEVLRGLAREDLFTVVLEHFQTDTADWADWVLPATTQLEHWDVHLAYGHLLRHAEPAGDRPAGRGEAEQRDLPPARGAHGNATHPALQDDDVTLIRQALDERARDHAKGVTFDDAHGERLGAAQRAGAVPAVRRGRIPDAERQVRVRVGSACAEMGLDPLPAFTPPYEFPESVPELAARFPLTLISSPRAPVPELARS